jgi:hypothetical protein
MFTIVYATHNNAQHLCGAIQRVCEPARHERRPAADRPSTGKYVSTVSDTHRGGLRPVNRAIACDEADCGSRPEARYARYQTGSAKKASQRGKTHRALDKGVL